MEGSFMQPQQTIPYNPPPRRSTGRRWLLIGGITALIVVILGGLAIYHYTGPTRTVQRYFEDIVKTFNASDAYASLCPAQQSQTSVSQIQNAIDLEKSVETKGSFDFSGVTYTLADENFFGDAHVRLGGSYSVNVLGVKQKFPIGSQQIKVHSNGLGWCVSDSNAVVTN
jgi:hypothetical protein